MKARRLFIIFLVFLASTWTLHTITNNLVVDPQMDKFLVHKTLGAEFNHALWLVFLRVHIVTACLVLITGMLGFSGRILQKARHFHRRNGQVYMVSVLLSALTSIYLIKDATGGVVSSLSFCLLEVFWISATWQAYRTIRRKDLAGHRAWMIRSFALAFSNTTIHLYTLVMNSLLGIDFTLAYTIAVWASWTINTCIGELVVRNPRLFQQKAGVPA